MKYLIAVVLLSAVAVAADTLHIEGVRNLAPTDPAPVSRAFKVYVITGRAANARYTAQQTFSWGSQAFEVGKDYEILGSDAHSITVLMHDKKGRDIRERLNLVAIEEINQPSNAR